MIYILVGGEKIDTTRDLTFEERNLIQKNADFQPLKNGY